MGQMSDSEQCSKRLELDLISRLVNFSCELGQIITIYDFLWARRVILSNLRKPPTLPNFEFGQLFSSASRKATQKVLPQEFNGDIPVNNSKSHTGDALH